MKVQALNWNQFMQGNVVAKVPTQIRTDLLIASAVAGVAWAAIPDMAQAAGWESFQKDVLDVADWLARGVIIFGGGVWMFGNRTKALEILIGMMCGFEVIRHHEQILEWLKSI